ncbi:MAG: isoprenylcysteine carboxylmethyltransferase family protein [Planctomycetes bacterium]|nr:isoprenylcysteine carboxylmethyltransferase family protein [Planctomycetota bacterium]
MAFWSLFLWFLPAVVQHLGERLGESSFALPSLRWVGPLLFALASALGLTSAWWMSTRGRGTPLPLATAREFVVSGPYHFVRNPMALAGIAQGVAVGLWRDSPLVVLYATTGGLVWHFVARPPEEADLLARFGEPYRAYRQRVPLWLPRLPTTAAGLLVAGLAVGGASLVLASDQPHTQLARCALLTPLLALAAELSCRGRRRTH